jgi:hypothetical protein
MELHGQEKTIITPFFTGRKLIILDVLLKGRKYDQRYFVHHVFPDLKEENRRSHRRNPGSTFWVDMDNSMCHNGSKIESKVRKHDLFRMPRAPDSPDISPYDFWLFDMLKGIFKDQESPSGDEIGEAMTKTWNDLTLDDVQSVCRNWMSRLVWVIENGGGYAHE